MIRPKCIRYVPIKMPDELFHDLEREAARSYPPKSVSDVVKDCCEFRLGLIASLRMGYYRLRLVENG